MDKKQVGKLVDDHWNYIVGMLLEVTDINSLKVGISALRYTYKQAMLHGYKHGYEDAKKKK